MTDGRRDARAALLARRDRIEAEVRQMVRGVEYWNRHVRRPTEPLCAVDDNWGSLAGSLALVGLDLDSIVADEVAVADLKQGAPPATCEKHGCELEYLTCWQCSGEGELGSACIDDMCHGEDECLHGDRARIRCDICRGHGRYPVCPECAPEARDDG